ncbi:MAG: DAK2 domain-containing protein [Clostridia bacterium]|nr:DAK2 domain-containing protein [Clostridia bacterium]
MNTKRIDGSLFEKMIRAGLNSLCHCEKEINALNVFPVADGDTGTNMRLTLENGIRCAQPTKELNDYLKALSSGMLLGARGNSGVILSQLFKGIYLELSRCSAASPVELRNAFIRGYKAAYESVINPVEGTILTVAREGIEQATKQQKRPLDVESLLTAYLSSMEISLAATPDVLPILAEMGVVDSGAKGYIAIIQGMLDQLTGGAEKAAGPYAPAAVQHTVPAVPAPDLSKFTENSDFIEGYCMEFILQLMKKPGYIRSFRSDDLVELLGKHGDSLVVVQDGMRVKVHVHTKKPAPIIQFVQQYGEFLTFKLENMQLQHNEYVEQRSEEKAKKPAPEPKVHQPISVVAVVNGEGNKRIFRELGCKCILDGGATMNTSSEEFLSAIKELDADAIVILPNGPNMMLAAQQAVELSGLQNVRILPAKSPAQGYYALAMDVQDSTDIDQRINQMRLGIESVDTLLVTKAARDYAGKDINCRENEFIAIADDELVYTAEDAVEAVVGGLKKLEGFDDKETCIFFRGAKADATLEDSIRERLEEEYPLLELTFEWGGQEIYDWIIGVS